MSTGRKRRRSKASQRARHARAVDFLSVGQVSDGPRNIGRAIGYIAGMILQQDAMTDRGIAFADSYGWAFDADGSMRPVRLDAHKHAGKRKVPHATKLRRKDTVELAQGMRPIAGGKGNRAAHTPTGKGWVDQTLASDQVALTATVEDRIGAAGVSRGPVMPDAYPVEHRDRPVLPYITGQNVIPDRYRLIRQIVRLYREGSTEEARFLLKDHNGK